ncbi:MAG TPA: DUF1501 domain-containing protein, partial [Gemmataceae bacterium]|nr:DUF1501 domain-containing protein [Gemmataceae bacterium]
ESQFPHLSTPAERESAGSAAQAHTATYKKGFDLTVSPLRTVFEIDKEPAKVITEYGGRQNGFGMGCLLARKLVEKGVTCVEIDLGGWDTHANNFDQVKRLSEVLDPAWGTLMEDLQDRGLLDSTLIVWMGEFGRTPKINRQNGRDHFPNAWSTVLAGGGIKGGQAVGRTSKDGMAVEERPVSTQDFLATICRALGIDPLKQNMSNVGRPIRIVDRSADPIAEVLS